MTVEPLQLAVFAITPFAWAAAWWIWVRPHAWHGPASNVLLTMLLLVMLGGFGGAFFWWFPEAGLFGWKLPLLASRMLSGAGWAFALVCYAALRYRDHAHVRLALVWIAVYIWPLAIAAPLFHLDRFDFSRLIVWPFFIIVAGLTVTSAWLFVRRPWPLDRPQPARPARGGLGLWFTLVAVLTLTWGLALFATDRGFSAEIWSWQGDLLTTRLIAVMLLTIGAGALLAWRDRVLAPAMLGATIVYGLTVTLAHLANAHAGRPWRPVYVAVFMLLAAGSAIAWWRLRSGPQRLEL